MWKLHKQKGQGLVEFAIVLPLFVLMMVGIFMVAVFCYNVMAVSTMARDTARQLVVTSESNLETKKDEIVNYYKNSSATKPIFYSWSGTDDELSYQIDSSKEYITVTVKAENSLNLSIPGLPDTIAKSETMYWEAKPSS